MTIRTACETCNGEGQIIHAITKKDQSVKTCADCLGQDRCPGCKGPLEWEGDLFGGGPAMPVCSKRCGWNLGA